MWAALLYELGQKMSHVFRSYYGSPLFERGAVVCVGAFDGLHIGHQALVKQMIERARMSHLPTVVVSFEPLPREFFAGANVPSRLSTTRTKLEGLLDLGVDAIGLLRFDRAFASMSVDRFVQQLLINRLATREIWVGADFRFGFQRQGTLDCLRRWGRRGGFTVQTLPAVQLHGERVSATRIRQHLAQGAFTKAAELLGHPYIVRGRVVRGQQLGRTIGFPTANIRLRHTPPLTGTMTAWVHGASARPWPAIVNIGRRPTVAGQDIWLEAHLLDFHEDLYGKHLAIEFICKLRDEKRFENLTALTAQLHCDAAIAHQQFAHR